MTYTSGIICLIPDDSYHTIVEDPHITLAFLGKIAEMTNVQKSDHRWAVNSVAKYIEYNPLNAKINGTGVFSIDPEFNDGNTLAYLDLVDSQQFPNVFSKVQHLHQSNHGFIPHMTRAYGTTWIPDLAKPKGAYPVRFGKIAVWYGEDERYEVELP